MSLRVYYKYAMLCMHVLGPTHLCGKVTYRTIRRTLPHFFLFLERKPLPNALALSTGRFSETVPIYSYSYFVCASLVRLIQRTGIITYTIKFSFVRRLQSAENDRPTARPTDRPTYRSDGGSTAKSPSSVGLVGRLSSCADRPRVQSVLSTADQPRFRSKTMLDR